jgi:hypothetical protein
MGKTLGVIVVERNKKNIFLILSDGIGGPREIFLAVPSDFFPGNPGFSVRQ